MQHVPDDGRSFGGCQTMILSGKPPWDTSIGSFWTYPVGGCQMASWFGAAGHWYQIVVEWMDPVGGSWRWREERRHKNDKNDGIRVKELAAACQGISVTSTHKYLGLWLALIPIKNRVGGRCSWRRRRRQRYYLEAATTTTATFVRSQ